MMDSDRPLLRNQIVDCLVRRRCKPALATLVTDWADLDDSIKEIIGERSGCLSLVLRDAIVGTDSQACRNACDAVLALRDYTLVTSLIAVAENDQNPLGPMVAETLLELALRLYDELASPPEYSHRHDPQRVRDHMLTALEPAVRRYGYHHCMAIMEAFLVLASRDNPALKLVLRDPQAPAYRPLAELLTSSPRPSIMRLVLSFLDDPQAPNAAFIILSNRRDIDFVRRLLHRLGDGLSEPVRRHLKQVETVHWVSHHPQIFSELNEHEQQTAVQVLLATSHNRLQVFEVIRHVLAHGLPEGRQAAAAALVDFKGVEANSAVLQLLTDADPIVQSHAVGQLRQRGITESLRLSIDALDSSHEEVRASARDCLREFTFACYLAAFEGLDADIRRSAGSLIRKIDLETIPALKRELEARGRGRRLRALEIVAALGVADELESYVLPLAEDPDHFVRMAALQALAYSPTEAAQLALETALSDRSVSVQQTAIECLQLRKSTENNWVADPTSEHDSAHDAWKKSPRTYVAWDVPADTETEVETENETEAVGPSVSDKP